MNPFTIATDEQGKVSILNKNLKPIAGPFDTETQAQHILKHLWIPEYDWIIGIYCTAAPYTWETSATQPLKERKFIIKMNDNSSIVTDCAPLPENQVALHSILLIPRQEPTTLQYTIMHKDLAKRLIPLFVKELINALNQLGKITFNSLNELQEQWI